MSVQPPHGLMAAMQILAETYGLQRVEAQFNGEELAPDGKTRLRAPHSVLFLPGLGWTMKNDVETQSWGDAKIIQTVRR